ncbi:MAG: TonB-dependent receptor [Cytophagia bacterium]|nr:MAG: TonB-dependent receptor [Runella sp.]TAG18289.1 MAG: TonB-dependent receptor [Cytophagales bacterium]TAG37798.1 MAG: TonB-dependent receptor [Cytophagia bacterium]TAG79031.1 MAG: TonB-dependent receptor [Cytophagales bacterium]
MYKTKIVAFLTLAIGQTFMALAQTTDSLKTNDLEQVVVTATRSERPLSTINMPVTVINQKQIKAIGSLRLNDVLAEQTGLAIVNDHGQGIQIQGFNPDYTLILVDGEPLIGRTAGTLELSRLAVGNIKQIEIIKGPSSSLYGSEALAGVVNIITSPLTPDGGTKFNTDVSLRYGTNRTADLSSNLNFRRNKFSATVFGNHFRTGGYDLTPDIFGPTVGAFQNNTLQTRLSYAFSKSTKLSLSGRYFVENQNQAFLAGTSQITGVGKVNDWNLNPVLSHHFSEKFRLQARLYATRYRTDSRLNYENGNVYDETFFVQNFTRPEFQAEYYFNARNTLTVGGGHISESVEATRYTDKKRFQTNYAFAQYEWQPTSRWNITAGSRFDAHSVYGSQLSPKLAAQWQATKSLAVRGSAGVGFKAPDFRQLYLNFTNAVAGYSVFGSEELPNGLARLNDQVSELLMNPALFGNIRPESSTAVNLGVKWKPESSRFSANLNVFRNDINDLIETQAVARLKNGQNVFSYLNLNQVFTQGAEIELNYSKPITQNSKLIFSAGYQYLEVKDKAIVQQLKDGNLFRRNPETLVTERLKSSDYGGLFGRSRHMANAKLFYENDKKGISATLRAIYRGRYGFGDRNGNLILDAPNEYVRGYVLWNASASKQMGKYFDLQAGVDNLFNYTDNQFIPSLAGRLAWVRVAVSLGKKG